MAITSSPPRTSNKRGLGRGLAALIPESDFDLLSGVARGSISPAPLAPAPLAPAPLAKPKEQDAAAKKSKSKPGSGAAAASQAADQNASPVGEVRYLELGQIEPNPFQPRQVWSETELDDLADSLREHGVLQPVLVRPLPNDKGNTGEVQFQLIAGERRWRAAARAGLGLIPAIVREVDDRSALELAIIENVQRHDISAIESAQAYRRLASEFGLSQEKIAGRVGKSRAAVANTIRLLDLPAEAIEALRQNQISEGHGRALLTASGDSARRALLRRVVRDGLSVREVERLAREDEPRSAETARLPRAEAPDIARLEDTLQRNLGMRLKLRARRRGGQLIIDYSSPEELQRLVKKLTGNEAHS